MRKNRPAQRATDIDYLAGFMLGLRDDEARLREIQTVYDHLTLLGQLLCAGTDITQMRTDFKELADVLLAQLAQELRKKAVLGLRSNARVAIDILVRNLFERTADIGFLATDSEICAYAERDATPAAASGEQAAARAALRARFGEYIRKYSVYHDIILLAPDGRVLVRFDESQPLALSRDALIAASLTTENAYVETFRASDLLPGEDSPLIYSFRVMAEDRPVGVLCLCFRFADECQRIFRSLVGDDEWTVINILTPDGTVIASSDPYQFPVGAPLGKGEREDCRISRFAGREYLAVSAPTHGYQGYPGPGWVGQALAPLNHAFEMALAEELGNVPPATRAAVLETTTLFSTALRDIPLRAATIQRELDRTVWNGNVWLSRERSAMNTSFAKVLLWEIGSTGMRTRSVFSESTTNLYETVVSAVLSDCSAQAALAIDIMDRNLYERANDCRWWALTGAFREALAGPLDGARRARLTALLRTINGLYTVYANLLVFDVRGEVLAVANPAYDDWVGRPLHGDWVRQVLALRDAQHYCVSPFAPTALYADRPTYVYAAAIPAPRAPGAASDNSEAAGGIAVVFDAAPQFIAMLEDALPRKEDGAIVDGAFALFAERDGRIIASTDDELAPGTKIDIGRAFLSLGNGGAHSNIIEFRDRYYAVGSRMSSGYREYKSAADCYRNDVVALVFVPLSDRVLHADEARALGARAPSAYARRPAGGEDAIEFATFTIAGGWYGVRSSSVVEAIDAVAVTTIPGMPEWASGCIMHDDQPITVFDLASLLGGTPAGRAARQIVVVRVAEQRCSFGLLVDALGEIPEITASRIEPIPGMLARGRSLTESLVKPHPADPDKRILVILSPERVLQRLASAGPAGEEKLGLDYCAA